MALTECWGNSSDLEKENLNITGYKLIIKGKKYNKNGGIMIYVKTGLEVKVNEMDTEDYGSEILAVKLKKTTYSY